MSAELIRRSMVHFSGHVQGVGFRYSVVQVAKGYEVTGYVENLTDGRVELLAEGKAREVDQFIAAVSDRMAGFIRKIERQDSSAPRSHQGFVIR